jgi:hypothetical protein
MRRTIPLLALLAAACGPNVSEMRLVAATPRAADCDLNFLQVTMADVAPGGKYEILGHVTLSEQGVQDPLKEEYRAVVRPRACAMGGEAVAILASGTATPWALSAGGTTIDYVVLRKPQAQAKTALPAKF